LSLRAYSAHPRRVVAILSGLVRLWLGLAGRIEALHRGLGRTYVAGIVVGRVGAFYLALTIDPKYFVFAAGLSGLACAWVVLRSALFILEELRKWLARRKLLKTLPWKAA